MSVGHTLYINKLNERIGIDDLKSMLFELFSTHGLVLDVVAHNSLSKKGQAFVVFSEVSSAMTALSKLNGFVFCGKPLNIEYARSKSDAIALLDGTYKPRKMAQILAAQG